ncbi:MAG: DNA primase [Candidatus Paceibacterota bacterium]
MASDAVEKIKERLSIVDVVAPYVELHKAGKNYKGKSPFTNEKTPSFYVSPDRGMYYCFSSSQGGDIFTFVEKMEGVDFKGALKILAEKAGVELVPEDPKKRNERDQQYALIDEAAKFYSSYLLKKEEAGRYLKDRGVKPSTIGAWRIGYAPGPPEHGWRDLREHLAHKGFSDAEMQKAGLIKSADAGKAPYDVFRDRIMFPICDPSGRIVAFSGRILSKDSDAPKYVNSPETELFDKSSVLFGYDKAKHGIRQYDFSLIVEGQFDVVLAHQAGYTNAVAVSGTALTANHVALLQRLSSRVVLALDADRAGIAAVKRGADVMLARGMDVKVARLQNGEDPADIIEKDLKQFKDIIGHATHVIEFLLAVLKEEARDERTFKLRARDEVVPYLLRIESRIDREHFEGVVAEALNTTTDAIHLELARLERDRARRPAVATEQSAHQEAEAPASVTRKEALLAYMVAAEALLSEKERAVVSRTFEAAVGRPITAVRDELSAEVISPLVFQLENELADMRPLQRHEELAGRLQELRELLLKETIREKRTTLAAAERTGDEAAMETLMGEVAELHREFGKPRYSPELFNGEA